MIAVRRLEAGRPSAEVEIVQESVAKVMFDRGEAVPANQRQPEPVSELEQHVDENVEVLGLTDARPEFFEEQDEREKRKDMRSPLDRMQRGGKRR